MHDHPVATELSWNAYVDAVASPMVVFDRHLDVVAANALAGAVSASFRVGTNLARFAFLNPMVEETTAQWQTEARRAAAALRASIDEHEDDARFRELLGELMARSGAFAAVWADDRTSPQTRGVSVFRNPLVGVMRLAFEQFRRGDGQTVLLWVPADEASAQRLERLRGVLKAHPAR